MRSLFVAGFILISSAVCLGRSYLDSDFATAEIGSNSRSYNRHLLRWLPAELEGWQDPASMSTSKMSSQCGVLSEVKLIGDSRFNFIFIGIVNNSKSDVRLNRVDIKAVFAGGRERVLIGPNGKTYEDIKSNWYTWGFASFPNKVDFKDQDFVKVTIPLELANKTPCNLEVTFERNIQAPANIDYYTAAPNSVWSFSYIQAVGITPAAATTFDNHKPDGGLFYVGTFEKPTAGRFFALDILTLGDIYESNYYNAQRYRHAVFLSASAGPAWRWFYSNRLTGYANAGVSLGYLKAEAYNDKEGGMRYSPGIYTSYTLDWAYSKGNTSRSSGDYFLGLTFFAKYYPWIFDGDRTDYGAIGISFDIVRVGN